MAPDGFKLVDYFDREDYDNLPQNWWVLQDRHGIIYVGNLGGLLSYDGMFWGKIAIPNYTARSMAIDDTDTIFIGGRGESPISLFGGLPAPGRPGLFRRIPGLCRCRFRLFQNKKILVPLA